MILQSFKPGRDYCELSPREGQRKWRWKLLQAAAVKLPSRCRDMAFFDRQGRVWATIESGSLTVSRGYVWNGCSPKRHLPLIGWIGSPDSERNIFASLVHDLLYQASDTEHFPFSRFEVDVLFRDMLRASGFAFTGLYYGAVRDFGESAWRRSGTLISSLL